MSYKLSPYRGVVFGAMVFGQAVFDNTSLRSKQQLKELTLNLTKKELINQFILAEKLANLTLKEIVLRQYFKEHKPDLVVNDDNL